MERFVAGRTGQAAVRALALDPTLNVQGLWSGYTGPGGNTITPAEAHARVDIRLVPDMDPETTVATLRRHFERHGFGDLEIVENDDRYRAWWTSPDHPLIQASVRASEAVAGKPAVLNVSAAGTEPMWDVAAAHDLPMTTIGATDPDIRVHAPDESYSLENGLMAARMFGRFMDELAALD